MTLHNLDSHISWLLQNRPTFPGARPVNSRPPSPNTTRAVRAVYAEFASRLPTEPEESTSVELPNDPVPPRVNAVPRFAKPTIPCGVERQRQQVERIENRDVLNEMARLASAAKPKRATLLTQHQIPTPVSTTNSLSASYNASFRASADTSTGASNKRTTFTVSRGLQTPQTPRQTPHPLSTSLQIPEPVDLTGDDDFESSPLETFGDPQRLLREDSALRTAPLFKSSRKRKSEEISVKRAGKKIIQANGRPDSQEYIDIDLFDEDEPPPKYTSKVSSPDSVAKPKPATVKSSIEDAKDQFDYQEEHTSVIETLKVQTRVVKSVSRVPTSELENKSTGSRNTELPNVFEDMTGTTNASPSMSSRKLQISPMIPRSSPERSMSPSFSISQNRRCYRMNRIVRDSEDEDDDVLEEVSKIETSDASNLSNATSFESSVQKSQIKISPPGTPLKTRSPCRDVDLKSLNSKISHQERKKSRLIDRIKREEEAPSPFQRDSPSAVRDTVVEKPPPASQTKPSSTLSPEDKHNVELYMKNPHILDKYPDLIEKKLLDHQALVKKFLADEVPLPTHLGLQRRVILEQQKSFNTLTGMLNHHDELLAQRDIAENNVNLAMEDDEDTSRHEADYRSARSQMKEVESQIAQVLRASGAAPLLIEGQGQRYSLASGSSGIGHTQIVLQTQMSVVPSASLSSLNYGLTTDPKDLRRDRNDFTTAVSENYPKNKSASPSRRLLAQVHNNSQSTGTSSYYRDLLQSKTSDISDDEFPDDIGDEDLLECDTHNQSVLAGLQDDYGDINEEDLEEITRDVEHRHSFDHQPPVPTIRKDHNRVTPSAKVQRPPSSKSMYQVVSSGHTDLMRFSWSTDVKKVLTDRFQLRGFRQNQLEAINATLGGKDAFVLMPTGGGKSLCYQLPAIVQSGKTKGVTVVISPLISLMDDQVAHLKRLRIQAFLINGDTPPEARRGILSGLSENYPEQFIQLLYLTPEMIGKSFQLTHALSALYKRNKLARFVIDEAHCVSEWGHDFRPDYKGLSKVRVEWPGVPILALTATATENVKLDVMHNLGLKDCQTFTQSFNRPNLTYEVRAKGKKHDVLAEMAQTIKDHHPGQSGIIYTLSRIGCEEVAQYLRKQHRLKAYHYHASLNPEEKTEVQNQWQAGKISIIVATIAFGMGIDKADVRFVMHHTLPKSLEGYYQETGRAGRDGKRSACYLFYGYQDTAILKRFIEDGEGNDDQKERQRKMLGAMVRFSENKIDCRRVEMLSYFGERFTKDDCKLTCDNCNSDTKFETVDFTKIAQAVITVVKALQKNNVTILHCVDLLRGSKAAKFVNSGDTEVEGYGEASHMLRCEVERLIYRLLGENALAEHNVINRAGFASQYIMLGPNCRDFAIGRRKLKMQVRVSQSPDAPSRPKTKSATKSPKKYTTGVAGSMGTNLHPQSTNVSSPVAGGARRRNAKRSYLPDDDDADEDLHGYTRDGFVTSDHSEDEDDGFEPVRDATVRHQTNMKSKRQLGPPITRDPRMTDANLTQEHQYIISHFVAEAKILDEKIRNQSSLRKPLFGESQFREMAINWTVTIDEMLEIPGIDTERVNRFGDRFLPLLRTWHANYEAIMDAQDERDIDQNHQNVVNLVSNDEKEDDEEDEEDELLQDGESINTSRYFMPSARTQAFNEQVEQALQREPSRSARLKSPPRKNFKGKQRASKGENFRAGRSGNGSLSRSSSGTGSRGGRVGLKKPRKSSGDGFRLAVGGGSGIIKRKAVSKKPSNGNSASAGGSNIFQQFAWKEGGGHGNGNGGAFGAMPT